MYAPIFVFAILVSSGFPFQLAAETCPGSFYMPGHGNVSLTNAMWNIPDMLAGSVSLVDGQVVAPSMFGRTYFGDTCSDGGYHHSRYSGVMLLDRTLTYTTDLSGAGCGCNAAVYLTSLPQNPDVSLCSDYYCDANRVCGVACAEIDLQEANEFAWHSTLHVHNDGSGVGVGYGGGDWWNGHRDWTAQEYGPAGECIDTKSPFQVAVSFPTDAQGQLRAMEIRLSQPNKTCNLQRSVDMYMFQGRNRMDELTTALANGMTPIISYWKASNLLWMDGPGADGRGPCHKDDSYAVCTASSVKFYGFAVKDYNGRRLQSDPFV